MILHHQCCGCHLPPTPANHPREMVSHGYCKTCFVKYHQDDFTKEEMEEMVKEAEEKHSFIQTH